MKAQGRSRGIAPLFNLGGGGLSTPRPGCFIPGEDKAGGACK